MMTYDLACCCCSCSCCCCCCRPGGNTKGSKPIKLPKVSTDQLAVVRGCRWQVAGGRGQRGRWHAWDGRWQVAGTSVAGSMHGMAGGRLQGPAWQVACMGWQVAGGRGQRGRWHAWGGRWQGPAWQVAMHGVAGGRLQGPAWQVACMTWQVAGWQVAGASVAGGMHGVAGVG